MKIKVLSARFIAALKRKIDIDLDMYGSIQSNWIDIITSNTINYWDTDISLSTDTVNKHFDQITEDVFKYFDTKPYHGLTFDYAEIQAPINSGKYGISFKIDFDSEMEID